MTLTCAASGLSATMVAADCGRVLRVTGPALAAPADYLARPGPVTGQLANAIDYTRRRILAEAC